MNTGKFLARFFNITTDEANDCHHLTVKAMDEYAKERSIAFSEWCDRNEFTQGSDELWYTDLCRFDVRGYTTTELYELFTKENQEK